MLCIIRFCILVVLYASVFCGDVCKQRFKEVKLVPDYFDDGTAGDLKVVYDGNKFVECGNKLSILYTLKAPTVIYDLEGKCKRVSLVMFDPDAKTPALDSSGFLHWFVANIPAPFLKQGFNNQGGFTQATYFTPLTVTGDHRYTFCVYCQDGCIRSRRKYNFVERMKFNPRDLAKEQSLGNPVACNFFRVVPTPAIPIDKDVLKTVM